MAFVCRNRATQKFYGKYCAPTDDLQSARLFGRKCDAVRHRPYSVKLEEVEAVEVMVTIAPVAPAPPPKAKPKLVSVEPEIPQLLYVAPQHLGAVD